MTVYISEKEMKDIIVELKKKPKKGVVIVKGGYNIFDTDGYLVTEVRTNKNWKPHFYCEQCEKYLKKEKLPNNKIHTVCYGSAFSHCKLTGDNLDEMAKREKVKKSDNDKWIVFIYDKKNNKMKRISVKEFNEIINKTIGVIGKENYKDWWKEFKETQKGVKETYRGAKVVRVWDDRHKMHFIAGTKGFNEDIANEMLFFEKNGTDKKNVKTRKAHKWINEV